MKPIKICYRAKFQQPIGTLNPLRLSLFTPIEVEVHLSRKVWYYCAPGMSGAAEFPISPQATAEIAMKQLPGIWFEQQLTDWQCYELTEPSGKAVLLREDEFWIDPKNGKAYRGEPKKPKAKKEQKL